jgi:Exonuclease
MREIVIDTETTGLDRTEGHRIVEIGAVELVLFETVFLSLCRVDVDFKVNGVWPHRRALRHRRHLDAEEMVRNDLQLVLHYWLYDIVFLGCARRSRKYDCCRIDNVAGLVRPTAFLPCIFSTITLAPDAINMQLGERIKPFYVVR